MDKLEITENSEKYSEKFGQIIKKKARKNTPKKSEKYYKNRENTEKSEKYLENREKYSKFRKIIQKSEKILKSWKNTPKIRENT